MSGKEAVVEEIHVTSRWDVQCRKKNICAAYWRRSYGVHVGEGLGDRWDVTRHRKFCSCEWQMLIAQAKQRALYVCIYVCMYIHPYVRIYIVWVSLCMCLCIYVCVYACMHVCVHVCSLRNKTITNANFGYFILIMCNLHNNMLLCQQWQWWWWWPTTVCIHE